MHLAHFQHLDEGLGSCAADLSLMCAATPCTAHGTVQVNLTQGTRYKSDDVNLCKMVVQDSIHVRCRCCMQTLP